jgi:hypothetical protein
METLQRGCKVSTTLEPGRRAYLINPQIHHKMKTKYLLVSSQDNPNIGVIKIEQDNCVGTARDIIPALTKMLEEEYSDEIEVQKTALMSEHPITIRAQVLIGKDDEENSGIDIELNETWLY